MRAYRRLHPPLRERVQAAIDGLVPDPRPRGAQKLVGSDDYRVRVGDHRIVFAVDDARRLVLIARISHRRDVYRR